MIKGAFGGGSVPGFEIAPWGGQIFLVCFSLCSVCFAGDFTVFLVCLGVCSGVLHTFKSLFFRQRIYGRHPSPLEGARGPERRCSGFMDGVVLAAAKLGVLVCRRRGPEAIVFTLMFLKIVIKCVQT